MTDLFPLRYNCPREVLLVRLCSGGTNSLENIRGELSFPAR